MQNDLHEARAVQADERVRDHSASHEQKSKQIWADNRETKNLDAASESRSVDDSVVGIPFPVSESILSDCAKSPSRACGPNKALLEKMAGEPREEPWASLSERAIRDLVMLEPGTARPRPVTYTIRNLECRKSICFVETASHMEGFHSQFFYFERANELTAGYAIDSRETKEDGTKMHVTLLPVLRRTLLRNIYGVP